MVIFGIIYLIVGFGFVIRDFSSDCPPLYVSQRKYGWILFTWLLWPFKIVRVMVWISRMLN